VPLLVYTLLRLALFAVVLVVGYLVGLRSWLLLLVALVVAFAVSYLALPRQRDAAAVWLAERTQRRKAARERRTTDADAEYEDSVVDQADSPR
jgi:antibiotic biosynthesis monooxygenase (ABM) superfamily enzyme